MSNASSTLSALRRETAAHHARLDGALAFAPGRVDRARFAGFLHATAELVLPLEAALAGVPAYVAGMPDFSRRQKAGLLLQDLAALGLATPVLPAEVPSLPDLAAALGAAYVLEGSMLGGAVLAKSLGPSLALSREHGLRYLTAYGPELPAMWQRFVGALSTLGDGLDPRAGARLVSSACAVFDAFYARFVARGVIADPA